MIYVVLGALALLTLTLFSWLYYLHSRLVDLEATALNNQTHIIELSTSLDVLCDYIRDLDEGTQYLWDNFDEISTLEEKAGRFTILDSKFNVKTSRGFKKYSKEELKKYLAANRKRRNTKTRNAIRKRAS